MNDSFGTLGIFTFGGFMGLALGFIMKMKEGGNNSLTTERHLKNNANPSSLAKAFVGSLIIFCFFPVLALDLNAHHGINYFNVFIGPYNIIISMGASLITALTMTCVINGKIIGRDLIHAPIAGAIVGGTASFYAINPAQPLAAGVIAGMVQTIIQNYFEKGDHAVLSTISWSLFGFQGVIGSVFATIYYSIAKGSNTLNLSFSAGIVDRNAGYMFLMAIISIVIGLATGILTGFIVWCISDSEKVRLFNDRQHWVNDDGISYYRTREN